MDFRVNYAFAFDYFDVTPETLNNPNLAFSIIQAFQSSQLGADNRQGRVFTYRVRLENTRKYTPPPMIKLDNGTMIEDKAAIIWDGGLGMVLATVRIPSCLNIDWNYLEGLKRNKLVDFYEVRNFNSEIVFYWRQLRGGETKTLNVDLIQRYAGQCMQKPHTAYPYYNNDQPIWVTARV